MIEKVDKIDDVKKEKNEEKMTEIKILRNQEDIEGIIEKKENEIIEKREKEIIGKKIKKSSK